MGNSLLVICFAQNDTIIEQRERYGCRFKIFLNETELKFHKGIIKFHFHVLREKKSLKVKITGSLIR